MAVEKAENNFRSLVLAEKEKGVWIICPMDVVISSDHNNPLLRAKEICAFLNYEVEKEGRGFRISSSEVRFNTYLKNTPEFTYTLNKVSRKREASQAAVIDADGNLLIAANSLSTLCYYKLFSGSEIKKSIFAEDGYDLLLAFSLIGVVKSRPVLGTIFTDDGVPFEKRQAIDKHFKAWVEYTNTKDENELKISETFTMFNGRRIRKQTAFRQPSDEVYWAEDKDLIFLEKTGLRGYVENGCGITLINSTVFFNTSGNYQTQCMKFMVEEDSYTIRLFEGLGYSKVEKMLGKRDYSVVKKDILKLFCYKISSNPDVLYTAILESEESIQEASMDVWEVAGDCSWKLNKENKCKVYTIKQMKR